MGAGGPPNPQYFQSPPEAGAARHLARPRRNSPGGQTSWDSGPTATASYKRSPWPILPAGVAALVLVLVVAAVGIYMGPSSKSDDLYPEGGSHHLIGHHHHLNVKHLSEKSQAPPTSDPQSKLLSNGAQGLPRGYVHIDHPVGQQHLGQHGGHGQVPTKHQRRRPE